ncbi:MAG TPA: hypothetical protein HPP77_09630 [Candidatus Hydrogenedentes bacterium]|nr:hypothetical protein [Candidatus Hydrogenedentota bacterium]HIJ73818.1 hypothetical protein [Candidatus Hydrogenedentota bacterium]
MINRLAVLGGSSVYIPEFILSIISRNLNVKEIVLVGRPGHKLPLVTNFCQRLIDKSGFPAKVRASVELEEAVAGAKYVVNHIRVGGMKARLRDEKLPPKHGMIGDECLGAGGVANALRTLPVIFDYVQRIEQVAPNATFINMTHPMGIVVEALINYSTMNVVGAGDQPMAYIKKLASLLHRDPADIWVDYIGLSRMGWIQDVKVEGRSYMAQVLERLEHRRDDGFDDELIELFRMIPTRTTSLYFHQDEVLKRQKTCARFRAEVLCEAEKQILKLYENEHLTEVPELTRERNAVWYEDTIVPLIQGLERKKACDAILCVRNAGAIRDLPDNCSVEIPVSVSDRGLKPRHVGSCPRFLKGLFVSVKESDRLTVEAARHKSYEYALQALTINPLVPSLKAAKKFLDRIVKEEGIELH